MTGNKFHNRFFGSCIYCNMIIENENSAQSFSDRSFWKSLRVVDVRAFGSWMSAPKCLFFQDCDRPDRSFGPGYPREWPPDVRGMSVPKTSSLGWFFVLEIKSGQTHFSTGLFFTSFIRPSPVTHREEPRTCNDGCRETCLIRWKMQLHEIHKSGSAPPPRKCYENNSPRIFLCNFRGWLRQNYVIPTKLTPRELFCVIGGCWGNRLFHVELREICVAP